jgi:hypothetical protein
MKELLKDNMQIWKFTLLPQEITTVEAPEVIFPLHVDVQSGTPCVWAMVDPASPKVMKQFQTVATGEPFDPTAKHYIGTVQMGSYVWHIFSVSNHM